MIKNLRYGLLFLVGLSSTLSAAPRLSLPQTAFTVSVVPGSNGPTQTVDAANSGDGALNLQTSSSVPWLVPTLGAAHACASGTCIPVQIALQTASLAKGTYTGSVTISDPNALDAPQVVTVTVLVGGSVPDKLEFFVPPGGSATSRFTTASPVTTTLSNSPWLSIAVDGDGTFKFNVPYKVTATALSGMSGDSNGTIALTGSSFAPDNKTIAVLLHVTTLPILKPGLDKVTFRIVQGTSKQTASVALANGGQGTLSVTGVTATASSGTWLTAQTVNNGASVSITADPAGLSPNTYQGTVMVSSNAANSSVTIPVQLTVVAQTGPVASAGGVVNNETFAQEAVAPGDIVDVFGDQFTLGDFQLAGSVPLTRNLSGTQVFVNDQPAPLYFISGGQVAFQIPFDAVPGPATVRVDRNGQRGNQVLVTIAPIVPRIKLLQGGPYAVITTPDGSSLTGNPNHPAKPSDVVVIYAIGLGVTDPPVDTGVGAPGGPNLATVHGVQVCIGATSPFTPPSCNDALFAGLTPSFVGLYQINAAIPATTLSGTSVPFYFLVGNVSSNVVQLALQ